MPTTDVSSELLARAYQSAFLMIQVDISRFTLFTLCFHGRAAATVQEIHSAPLSLALRLSLMLREPATRTQTPQDVLAHAPEAPTCCHPRAHYPFPT